MVLNFSQVGRLLNFLVERKRQKLGLANLVSQMKADVRTNRVGLSKAVSKRSIERILELASSDGETDSTDHWHYSAERLFEKLEKNHRPSASLLFDYLEERGFQQAPEHSSFLEGMQEFLSTKNNLYGVNHLDAMIGDYHMYRRCWFRDNGKTYMRSFVRVRADDVLGIHSFIEIQKFPKERMYEYSKGYLFPSGNSILAICNASDRSTVKYLSISDLFPPQSRAGEPVEAFSGNGIASSDTPPHTGYGFHCVRVGDEMNPTKSEDLSCRIFSFQEFESENLDCFHKVLYHDRFINVNFSPKSFIPVQGDS